ncbi:MAG: hypothetical protein NW226_26565 [Microscillaceae bacterium]|nr:hypothetical protein [Microscillaceae bacterium]
MGTKITVKLTLLSLGLLFLMTSCPDSCLDISYNFEVTSYFTPEIDSISLGDTLYLISEFPTDLEDVLTSSLIDYSNAKTIGGILGVSELIPNDSKTPTGAVSQFKYIAINGKIFNDKTVPSPEVFQQLSYEETSSTYRLKIGLIPTKKGVYFLTNGDALSRGRKESNCESASFSMQVSNQDQNLYLLEDFLGLPADENNQRLGYCFRVVD